MGFWFYMLSFFGWFRVDPLEEEAGMDVSRHKGSAYAINSATDDQVDRLSRRESERFLFLDSSVKSGRSLKSPAKSDDGKKSPDETDALPEATKGDEEA